MKALLRYSLILGNLVMVGPAVMAQGSLNADRANSEARPKEYVTQEWQPSLVPDGMIDRVNHDNKALQWHNIREIDVAFKRRVWKRIDVKEKQNVSFLYEGDEYTGGGAFIEILVDAARKGKIRAFADDKFTRVLSTEDLDKNIMGESRTTTVVDPVTGEEKQVTTDGSFDPSSVDKYEIQEDWIFDRNAGRMISRIRAISPLMITYTEDGVPRGFRRLFTVYYPEARDILAQYEVYNPENDVRRMSWTDFLDRGFFSSYVIKTSHNNPTNENYKGGFDGLIKGQDEMNAIIEKEMDMWEL
ncbi:type IX secretion system ring subunit PorN/GldN [Edaphocola flava]|uniref:type IX secretion system ring protein PorN/GldN n=1 Tax=Edaphocola flava TaxID=2499629 RepID=UPI00100AFD89|nr:gliding motility protein GldN [Edaphocola flava]